MLVAAFQWMCHLPLLTSGLSALEASNFPKYLPLSKDCLLALAFLTPLLWLYACGVSGSSPLGFGSLPYINTIPFYRLLTQFHSFPFHTFSNTETLIMMLCSSEPGRPGIVGMLSSVETGWLGHTPSFSKIFNIKFFRLTNVINPEEWHTKFGTKALAIDS